MEKYRLVQEHKAPEVSDMFQQEESTAGATTGAAPAAGGEAGFPVVRITQQGKPRNYISYAMGLFVRSRMLHGRYYTSIGLEVVSSHPFLSSFTLDRPKGPPPSSSRPWDGPSTRL